MLSRWEVLLYRDYLNIPAGMIASYYDPMGRAFNLIFIPAVSWILFLIYATKPFKSKGIKALLMIGFTAFGIVNGLYAPWVTFSQAWFFLILAVPAFYYILETFIHRSAIYNLAGHYSNLQSAGRNKILSSNIKKYNSLIAMKEQEKAALERKISRLESTLASLEAMRFRYVPGSAGYNAIDSKIKKIEKEIDKAEDEKAKKVKEIENLKAKLATDQARLG